MKTPFLKSFLLLTVLLSSLATNLYAENIVGQIVDKETSNPIEFANVVILNSSDSSYVSGTISDREGRFSLKINVNSDSHHLRISFLGYQTATITVTNSDMGLICLSPSSTNLSEVVVKANRKIYKMENEGISVDVGNSILKDMGSLPDILGQLPFLLKRDNSYTILGKGTPVFYINNRAVRDNAELQQISSKDIKKVTIIADPGAEYDASVNAIIKIETVRPSGEGLSGSLYTFNRYNKEYSNWDRISLNYRRSKLDIFSNLEFLTINTPKNRLITNNIK